MELMEVLDKLLNNYGPQGWWPLQSMAAQGNRNEGGYLRGPSVVVGPSLDPADAKARFEIAVSAVLAQNTAWAGASRSMECLSREGILDPTKLLEISTDDLHALIKTSGTYARKTDYIRNLSSSWADLDRGIPDRSRLLAIAGIGFETADCILLYAYGVPSFIADAYARRIMTRLGLLRQEETRSYEAARKKAEKLLPSSAVYLAEAHALLVEHGKRHCRTTPRCQDCPVEYGCQESRKNQSLVSRMMVTGPSFT